MSDCWMSDRVVAPLAGSDPERFLERRDEDFPIANASGPGGTGNQCHYLVRQRVGDDDLDLDLRQEIHRVLTAAIHLGVTLLAAEAAHLGHGHADDAGARERFLHVVELERLDDRFDLLHPPLTASARASWSSTAPSASMRPSRGRASPARGSPDSRGNPFPARRGPPSRPPGSRPYQRRRRTP